MKKLLVLGALLLSAALPSLALAHTTNADKTPPKITYLHISSSGSVPSTAKAGDKVTISVTADEKVTPIVLVASRVLFAKSVNTGGNAWDASYTVDPRDPAGKIDYLITLADTSGNIYICTSAKLPIQLVPRCLTTDGSSVTVTKVATPPADTTAPVIATHADIRTTGTASGVTVTYTNPTATDNVDSSVVVSCSPASGSLFALGTTTVACSAHDTAGNNATPTTFKVIVSAPAAPADTQAPVIAPHADISVVGTSAGATVTYTNPTATDNVDMSVAVACAPSSGSTFAVGTTTVTCSAHDAANNNATSTTFAVGVSVPVVVVPPPPPTPYTMASQGDESYLCSPNWRDCFTGGEPINTINLGLGSTFGTGTLKSITIAKDETSPFVSQPWIVQLQCFTDAAYTQHCTDWLKPTDYNGNVSYEADEFLDQTTDNKHWSADFTNPSHETAFDGTSPVSFNPNYYYRIIISDNGWAIGAYGSQTPSNLYYVITGMTK